jgi:hypothetical protein
MEEEKKEIAATESGVAEEMSNLQKIWRIFSEPSKTFTALSKKPSWFVPVAILLIVGIISAFITYPFQVKLQVDAIQEMDRLSPEQKQEIIERVEEQAGQTGPRLLRSAIQPVVLVFFMVFGAAVFLWFGGNLLLGADVSFKKVLSIYSYSALVGVFGVPATIVKLPLMMVKKSIMVQTSLAAVLPSADLKSVLFHSLSRFDIFEIWQIAVVSIGIAIVCNFSVKKSAGLVIGLWVVWSIIAVVLGRIFGGGMIG